MSTFFEMDCGGETVTLEKTDDGNIIFHGWDEETELAAIELGFEPSACLVVWNAVNNDALDEELLDYTSDGNTLMVETLLFAGASVKAKTYTGWTPLHIAARWGNTAVAQFLIKSKASVDAETQDGWTPLHLAAQGGRVDSVKVLLRAGANVRARTVSGKNPLSIASEYDKYDVVKVIKDWISEHEK